MKTGRVRNLLKIKLLVVGLNVLALLGVFTTTVYAGDLRGNAQQLLNDVYAKFVMLSTGAAFVGVGTGGFMKKFSMGKEQRVEMGNKVQKDSIIAWATVNGIGLVLNFLSPYLKWGSPCVGRD